jgi:hypothetical protein
MDGGPLRYEELQRRVELYLEKGLTKAAAELGMSTRGLQKTLENARSKYGMTIERGSRSAVASAAEFPDFPDEDISVEKIIALQSERFQKRKASHDAHTWFPIKLRDNKAIGICWFGDPHVDDNGCNWPTLERDVALCRGTEGMFGANVGDTTNNWSGRLVRLYANQDTSVATARRLAEWFMLGSGIRWLIFLLGNHDAWGDGSAILAQMARRYSTHKLVCHDWEARFTLRFPNGWEPRIYTAHNFKGNSIWNPMHGPMREGALGEDANLYVCGDKHTAGLFVWENVARGKVQTFMRVRGYKFMDDFARTHGYKEQQDGCAGVSVFDPVTKSITTFLDVEAGAQFLTMKRAENVGG